MGKALSGIVGVAISLYLVAVALRGNAGSLLTQLKTEQGYLEVLIAMYALYLLHEYGPTSKIVDSLIFSAIVAVAIKAAMHADISGILQKFGSGQASMLDTVKAILA